MNSDKKRILVVDDEETLCEVLSFNLENEGYEVTTALSAEEALALDLTSFDLILLDIMLGAISGTQIAEIMKRRKDTAEIPIIFCTAKDSEDDMVKGLNLIPLRMCWRGSVRCFAVPDGQRRRMC